MSAPYWTECTAADGGEFDILVERGSVPEERADVGPCSPVIYLCDDGYGFVVAGIDVQLASGTSYYPTLGEARRGALDLLLWMHDVAAGTRTTYGQVFPEWREIDAERVRHARAALDAPDPRQGCLYAPDAASPAQREPQ